MNCEAHDCKNQATQILNVGSQGRVERLCQLHVKAATAPLDASMLSYQLTGLDHSFSAEQSLQQTVDTLDDEKESLLEQLADARKESARLQELLVSRLTQQNAELRAELEALKPVVLFDAEAKPEQTAQFQYRTLPNPNFKLPAEPETTKPEPPPEPPAKIDRSGYEDNLKATCPVCNAKPGEDCHNESGMLHYERHIARAAQVD